ncbi:hypothetical protein F5I97DRAFT_1802088 [Phlebopus sp. FC_14]|nr:hypothetical protein F5I97DRAFT_1802088 [Phlebopus sp. FC_14]
MKELVEAAVGQPSGWRALEKVAKESTVKFLPLVAEGGIDFPTFVRCVTFRFWLVGFLQADNESLDCKDLSAFLPNDKTRNTLPDEIQQCIPSYAPDVIIPAYEKLWQSIAAAIVHCGGDDSGLLRHILLDFRDNPTDRQLVTASGINDEPSVSCIMNEVLRLHPPISQIFRTVHQNWWKSLAIPSVQLADIKAVQQRDTHGNLLRDPTRFDPSRWKRDLKPALFAFGGGPHVCPAEKWAPRAAALVASIVMERVDGVKFRFEYDDSSSASGCVWDGWSVHKGKRRDNTKS